MLSLYIKIVGKMWSISVTVFVVTGVGIELTNTHFKNTRYLEMQMLVYVSHVWANLS